MIENLAKKCELNYSSIAKVPERFNQNNQSGFIKIDINEILKKYEKIL